MTSGQDGSASRRLSAESNHPHFSLLEANEEAKLLGDGDEQIDGIGEISTRPPNFTKSRTAPGHSLRSISLPKGPSPHQSQTEPIIKQANSIAAIESSSAISVNSSFPDAKKPKKDVSNYYKKQNELLEDFKNDSEQIQVFQKTRTRQRLQSSTSKEPGAEETQLPCPIHSISEEKAPIAKEENVDSARLVPAPSNSSLLVSTPPDKQSLKNSTTSLASKDSMIARQEAAMDKARDETKAAARFAMITLFVNISLMVAKAVASALSGSLSIISSLVDSLVDITSGLVISISSRMIKKRDPYRYPRGRTRLEPLSLIIISVVMGFASVQLIFDAFRRMYNAYQYHMEVSTQSRMTFFEIAFYNVTHKGKAPNWNISLPPGIEAPGISMDWPTIAIMIATVGIKFTLFLICQKFKNDPSIAVLAMDHRNDCISNICALVFALLATHFVYYLDPLGAIAVSIYILYTWVNTGCEHLSKLSGRSAEPNFINRITKVCMDHDSRITHLDTVLAYHYGTKFLVEVHIVLDPQMCLKEAHDISESLQRNIESLPDVERAFVHPDYEYQHVPADEHKIV